MSSALLSKCCCAGKGKGKAKAEEAVSEAPAAAEAEPVSPFPALSLFDAPNKQHLSSFRQYRQVSMDAAMTLI